MLGPVVLDFMGGELSQEERELLQHPLVGGVILFTRNYVNREQLCALIRDVRKVRDSLIIAVDQEGGRVQRFKSEFTLLPPSATYSEMYQTDVHKAELMAANMGYTMASELLAVDVDISLAPVLDIDHGINKMIGDRSFGKQAEVVTCLAGAYISGMHKAGMQATGKHFPGHGGVAADSHLELPVDKRSYQTILKEDIQPFINLQQQLTAIMPAHIIYPDVDEKPAGFSRIWLQKILRQQLHFTGAIISDDLSMGGANFAGGYLERAQMALEAGCDLLLICNNRQGVVQVLDQLNYQPNAAASQRITALARKKNYA